MLLVCIFTEILEAFKCVWSFLDFVYKYKRTSCYNALPSICFERLHYSHHVIILLEQQLRIMVIVAIDIHHIFVFIPSKLF